MTEQITKQGKTTNPQNRPLKASDNQYFIQLIYDASEVVSKGSATEVLCYGTAVVIEPDK